MSNKTSDKNVANIEDDVRLIKRYLEDSSYKESDSDFFKNGGWEIIDLEIPRAMENILAELEQKDKRIQELEKENADLKKYNKTVSDRIVEYKKNSIPTQVVIDEIDKHNEKIEKYNEYREQGKETDVEYYENIANTAIVQVLQELLGGRNENG